MRAAIAMTAAKSAVAVSETGQTYHCVVSICGMMKPGKFLPVTL